MSSAVSSQTVHVVMVHYRAASYAVAALRSLIPEFQEHSSLRLSIVDNDSGGTHIEELQMFLASFPFRDRVELIENGANVGFGAGNNRVLSRVFEVETLPEFFFLLNPDTVVEAGLFRHVLQVARSQPRAFAVGAQIVNSQGVGTASAFRFPTWVSEFEHTANLAFVSRWLRAFSVVLPIPATTTRVPWVTGACALLRTEALQEVGLFDPEYFLYFEEGDLMLRAERLGWHCWTAPSARVFHYEAVSTGMRDMTKRRPAFWFRSRKYYFEKNHGFAYRVLADVAWIAGSALRFAKDMLLLRPRHTPRWIVLDFLRHSFQR